MHAIDMDEAKQYNYLDIRVQQYKRHVPFTLMYTKDRCVMLEVSARKKDIVGSYSVQGGGS